jgi:dimethylamine monooxygenase subunit A
MEIDGIAASLADNVYDYLQKQQGVKRLWNALALALQEDLVIVKDDGEMGVSELMHVCCPSHWNPGERVGQSLFGLHEPVANNEQLLRASKNTLQAMVNKGPFVRFVWSLNSTDELNLNPAFHTHGRKKPLADDPSQWFFRVERQTTLPMPELQRSLFTIRILVASLSSVLNDERKNLLAQSVLSMDEKLLRYKGLVKQKDVLLEYLQR